MTSYFHLSLNEFLNETLTSFPDNTIILKSWFYHLSHIFENSDYVIELIFETEETPSTTQNYQSTRQTSRHQPKFPYKNLHFLQQKPTSNHSSIFTHPSLKKWRQVNAHTRKKRASGDGTSVIGFFIRTIWGVASVLLLFLIVEMSVSARVIMIERADFRPLLLPFIFSVCRLLIWLLSGLYVGFGLAASVSLGESEVAVAWPWRPFPQTSRFELQWTLLMVKRSYEGGKCSFMFCCFPLAVMWCFNHLIGVLFCYVLSVFFYFSIDH